MARIVFIFLVLNSNCIGSCKTELDSIFENNFKIIEKSFTNEFATETSNLVINEKLNSFISLVSLLSGKGCENIDHFGISKINKSEYLFWKEWYKNNRLNLDACKIIDGYLILESGINNYEEEKKLIEYEILKYPEPILFEK